MVSSSGGVKDSWASARPRRRRSKSPADALRSMSTTPSARSWKFPVSTMTHYLTWWANSMQSRAIPCERLACCEIDQQTTKRQCVSLHGLLKVSRVLGGKQDFGANITKLFDGATDRKSPAASLKALYGYASNTPGARNGRYTDPMLEGQVGNLPGTSKQQAQNSIRARCPSGHVPAAPSTGASAPPAARLGRR